jgi:hypothetical protein
VKYHNRSDYDFLLSALSSQYAVKSHPIGTHFLGFKIDNDLMSRTLTLSYPGYVAALLTRLRPHGVSPAASPSLYTPPVYGSKAPQCPTGFDVSPPATPQQKKELEVAVGYLLYYGRSVDSRFLTATCSLASEQANPTLVTMTRLQRLLGYASAHPHGRKIYRASDMILKVLTTLPTSLGPRLAAWPDQYTFSAPLPIFTQSRLTPFITTPYPYILPAYPLFVLL